MDNDRKNVYWTKQVADILVKDQQRWKTSGSRKFVFIHWLDFEGNQNKLEGSEKELWLGQIDWNMKKAAFSSSGNDEVRKLPGELAEYAK